MRGENEIDGPACGSEGRVVKGSLRKGRSEARRAKRAKSLPLLLSLSFLSHCQPDA